MSCMQLLIIGTGYVGLVTGACFAEMGHDVVCLDIDVAKIEQLRKGEIPIYEPGLEELVLRNQRARRLSFTSDYAVASQAEICFLAVPTPEGSDGNADLSYVLAAAAQLAPHLQSGAVVVNKSTVPVGSTKKVEETIRDALQDQELEFYVVSNPEFLKEGDAIQDFMKPDRIVIGSSDPVAIGHMQRLYAPFHLSHDRLLIMDPPSAEMTKYAANAMLATRISFMNELAGLCELTGADITKVRKGIGSDQRIGYAFLYAGIGYGGSCFPKDIRALEALARQHEYPMPMVEAVQEVNARQKCRLGLRIQHYFGSLQGIRIAIWGLSFKPGTDDLREAPSLVLIRFLLTQGAEVVLFDPVAMDKAKPLFHKTPQVHWAEDEYAAAQDADAVALVTEWRQFRFLDLGLVAQQMRRQPAPFFDGRNQYDPIEMAQLGFCYTSMGRASYAPVESASSAL